MGRRRWTIVATAVLAWAGALAGCATSGGSPAFSDEELEAAAAAEAVAPIEPGPYRLQFGDVIQVRFTHTPELDEAVPVRPDGRIALRRVGAIAAAGRTPEDLGADLEGLYASFLRHPELVVVVTNFAPQEVYVGGEVSRAGAVPTRGALTALQAIIQAGGFKDSAELRNVVVLRDQGGATPGFIVLDLRDQILVPGTGNDVALAPRDIVFVPKTRIAKLNQLVNEYFDDLVPISRSFGLSYNFGPTFDP